jgi:uncharacterized protein
MTIFTLCAFALLAGFIDSIVGGGGLIQLPGLLITLPDKPIAMLFGTNKTASIFGTSAAVIQFGRRVSFHLPMLVATGIAALVCSYYGATLVSKIGNTNLKPFILALLVAVFIYTIFKKDLGNLPTKQLSTAQLCIRGALAGGIIGFYDGFFGPGAGSFYVLAFISVLGFDFLQASAHAKVANWLTNAAAMAVFIPQGNIIWGYALPMAAFNLLGGILGARMAIAKGNGFVRYIFLLVIFLTILRYAWDVFG